MKAKLILAGMFVAAGLVFSSTVTAQSPAPKAGVSIAILSLDSIRREAAVVKDIRSQISAYRKSFQTELQKEETALREANQELAKKRSILSPEAFTAERRKFEQRVVDLQRLVEERKRQLARVQGEAMLKVEAELNKIITGLAEQRNVDLVVRRAHTIMVAKNLDITQDVMNLLNQRLPKVAVTKPGK